MATFIWKKMDSPSRNDTDRPVSNYHDYILAYCRHRDAGGLFQMPKPEILKAYPLRRPDGRLARRRQLRKNGKNARREDRPSMWYPLIAPDGIEVFPVAPEGWEGRWVLSKETWEERERQGLTEWIKREYGWMPYYIELAPENPSVPWSTLWTDVDQNRQAKAKFTSLMKGTDWTFENPKPVDLVERMIAVAMGSDGICLDFFAGSGSTGHAVMAANADDGGSRRFILVQLPEALAGDHKHTLVDVCAARLKQASADIRKHVKEREPSDVDLYLDDAAQAVPIEVDLGFRVFKLASSNFRIWHADDSPTGAEELAKQLELYAENVLPGHSREEILYELVLKAGFPLHVPIEERLVGEATVFWIDGGALVICLGDRVTKDLLRGIMELKPARVLCLDHAFGENDQLKTNAALEMKAQGMVFQTV